MKKIKILVAALLIGSVAYAQQPPSGTAGGGINWKRGGNNGVPGSPNKFGTFWNSPIYTYTNGIQRMKINGTTPSTSGFVGIGTSNPLFRLHVDGLNTGNATAQGWTKGILLSNNGALMWSGAPATNLNYFMAHSSNSPTGDFYQGISEGIGTTAAVNYASKVHVASGISGVPQASTQIFKNLLVVEPTFERRFGVNVLTPARTTEIKSNLTNNWQLRLTNKTGAWVDFKSRNNGNLNINPQGGKTGINLGSNPTHTIDINGNARIRQVPIASTSPESLLIGQQIGANANSREVRRLNFTGNPNQVLLANGTWGTLPSTANADNGISVNSTGDIQLGVPCNIGGNVNIPGILANRLTTDRIVYQKNQHLWFASGNSETGGTGFGGQFIPTPFCGTGNTVEISANMNNLQYGNADASGLRFTKLTSSSPIIVNGVNGVDNTKVLTVDGDGDVVLTDVPIVPPTAITANNGASIDPANLNNVQWGQRCGAPGNPGQLLDAREIPMNNFSFNFTGQDVNDRVGIGTACAPTAKFQVLDNTGAAGIVTTRIETLHSNGLSVALGVQNTSTVVNSIAGYFEASSANKTHAIVVPSGGGNVGFGTTTPNTTYRLEVFGGTNFNGNIYQNGSLISSDQIFKTDVDSIDNAMGIINQLLPKTYYFDTLNNYGMLFNSDLQYGFIAQDVETILPELITDLSKNAEYDSLGNQISQALNYKSLNYNAFIAILAKGLQEQQVQIDSIESLNQDLSTVTSQLSDLEARLEALEECLENTGICNGGENGNQSINQNNSNGTTKMSIDIELNDAQNIVLEQNVPNPFAERTTINYSIPVNIQKAQMHFYNQNGQLINTVEIDERGEGQLNVFANDLSTGVYTYTLVVDGQISATKRMVRTK